MKFLRNLVYVLVVLLSICVIWTGCDNTTEPKNNAPQIVSLTANPQNLDWGGSSVLTVVASDADGDVLTYSWTSANGAGTFSEPTDSSTVTWTAPNSSVNAVITVLVGDGSLHSSKADTIYVTPHPIMDVSTTTLDFGSDTENMMFNVINTGTGDLTWEIDVDDLPDWLSVNQESGTTTTQTQVIVTADRTNMSGGSHTAEISVVPTNESLAKALALGSELQKISVERTITVEIDVPKLSVSPLSLDFGSEMTSISFNIVNEGGGGTLTWKVTESSGWLSVNPDSGSITVGANEITATISREGLAAGMYTSIIFVTSNGGDATVDVEMEVLAPELSVSTTSLDFGATTTSLNFNITNTGGQTLDWSITDDADWLTVDPTSGSTTNGTDQVTATVSRTGLDAGTYTAQISVASNDGAATVDVQMEVLAPELSVSETSLDFGETTTLLNFDITNTGGGTLDWSISDDADWLTVDPTSGSTTSETDQVTATVSRTGLAAGTYTAQISVTSTSSGNATVDVTMTVPEPPVLSVSQTSLDFGTTTTTMTFDITNIGAGKLTWSISESIAWLSAGPQNGSTTTETDQITVSVNRINLSSGTYTGQISVTSDGGDATVNVIMEVAGASGNIVFEDDFSGTLSAWTKSYCTASIISGECHVKGSTSGYYGTLYHVMSPYTAPEYTITMDIARVSTGTSSDGYGLYTEINDTGTPYLPVIWFVVQPLSSNNWALICYVAGAGTSSGWYLLASNSQGSSTKIKTGKNEVMHVSYTMDTSKRITIEIDGEPFYTTNGISALQTAFGGTISTSLKYVGMRTRYNYEVKFDNVSVTTPAGAMFAGSNGQEAQPGADFSAGNEMKLLPALEIEDIQNLKTVSEMLQELKMK